MLSRRQLLQSGAVTGAGIWLSWKWKLPRAFAQIPGGSLAPGDVDKYVLALVKPPAMPGQFSKHKDKYKIAVRQFQQQILPPGSTATTVWSYGPIDEPRPVAEGGRYY